MSKLTLNDVGSGYNLPQVVNANSQATEAALENTLSRDGTAPNEMLVSLDMNSNRVINLGSPVNSTDAARFIDVTGLVNITGIAAPSQVGNAGKSLTTNGTIAAWTFPLAHYNQTSVEISLGITPSNFSYVSHEVSGTVLPERYGAVGNGNSADLVNAALDTAAINTASSVASATGCPILFSRAYIAIPGTAQTGAATYNCAFAIKSGVTYIGNGGSIKMQDGYSTNGSPKEMAMFSTSVALTNVKWLGLPMDMNGANNLMSPARPATYNQFNHAAIIANGASGRIDNCTIKDCTFKNNAGVCFIVCQLVAAGTTPVLGKTWKLEDNLFLNGGTDTNDHTSVYGWVEDVVSSGNTFWQDSPPHTIGKTGGATCYEIHGSNHRVTDNLFYNYTLGVYVAPNFTSPTLGSIVSDNRFYCSDYGILIWRQVTVGVVYAALDDILIEGNQFYFDNYTYSGQPLYKAAIAYQGQLSTEQGAVNDIKITDNVARNIGTTLLSNFVKWDTSVIAAQKGSNLSITDNQVIGFTNGVQIITNATNGLGLTEISDNQFINLTPDSLANPPVGIYVNATGAGVDVLKMDSNSFTDNRGGGASFHTAINLTAGTVADLWLGPQLYKGLIGANFNNSGATITRQIGPVFEQGATNVADGGTISFVANHAGLTPRSITCTATASGEFVSVTTFGATTFTVAIKKHDNTAGTTQTVYWRVQF